MLIDKHIPFTPLEKLGEFGLIERIAKNFPVKYTNTIKGIGDDAAVLVCDEQFYYLVSTDMLVEGVHFDLSYTPLKHLGWKAVVVNLSDIYAMNGIPTAVTISLGLNNRFSVEAVDELYAGVEFACRTFAIDVVGGDTTTTRGGMCIGITALGKVEKSQIVYRNGAQKNDLICVTGDLGAAYAGFRILEREKQVFLENPNIQPDLAEYDYVVGRQLKPSPPVELISWFRQNEFKPTAMIDISDGLASEILHICQQSKVGARIMEDKIPIDIQTQKVAMEFKIDTNTFAFNGGEDYEILFTAPVSMHDAIKKIPNVSIIGYITDAAEGVNLLSKQGSLVPIQAQGWKHF
ncbi:MAG: thiamine-phosphate kinase [Bacteroidia bacterium]|nr:thiamine-phosphate kinase [Bacteroidia bacterium]MDW8345544.1 thiamine-phosphate kinase [Bacteroidia bacterium]